MRTRKRFGQHWLQSEAVLDRIVAAGELVSTDRVLEIGPGQGVLTQRLLTSPAQVLAVEIDRDLCFHLRDRFIPAMATGQFRLIEADFLQLNFAQALVDFELAPPNKVIANIPYYITAPILEKLLGTLRHPNPQPFETIVLLVQKEISDRLCATPGTRANGALTIRAQCLAECEEICRVPASAFKPSPKVESAVVRLRPRPFPTPVKEAARLDQIVKLGFAQKRKMLRNNLQTVMDRDRLTGIFEQLGISPQVRAEDLGVAQWIALSNALSDALGSQADPGTENAEESAGSSEGRDSPQPS